MDDDGPDPEAIVRDCIQGKSPREVARTRGISVAEVKRMLDVAAARMSSPEGIRRTLLLEAERLGHLKQALWVRALRDQDLHAAAIFIKASERLATMLGLNHPHGHIVTVTTTLDAIEHTSSTQRMLEAIRVLRSEPAPAEEDENAG